MSDNSSSGSTVKHQFHADELMPTYLEAMERDGCVTIPVSGGSMVPFVAHARDTVTLSPVDDTKKLRAGDIVLFRRNDGCYVMHRIVKASANEIIACGDAQSSAERGISKNQVLAKVTGIVRKGRQYDEKSCLWRFYATVWRWFRPLRLLIFKLYGLLKHKNTVG